MIYVGRNDDRTCGNSCTDKFDIALLDPPYRKGLVQQALPMVTQVMNKGGVIVCETPLDESLADLGGDFKLEKEYRYGQIKLSVFRNGE